MVAQQTVRTYEVNQIFRCVKGIWFYWKSRQIRFFSKKKTLFYFIWFFWFQIITSWRNFALSAVLTIGFAEYVPFRRKGVFMYFWQAHEYFFTSLTIVMIGGGPYVPQFFLFISLLKTSLA